jgi:hypothetical protein
VENTMTMRRSIDVHQCVAICAIWGSLAFAGCAVAPRSEPGHETGPPTAEQNLPCERGNVASRIPQTGPQCSAAGRSYSNEDIERTGATTTGRALQLLDPAITVSH